MLPAASAQRSPPTRAGACTTSAGWSAEGVGPNCTYVGKRSVRGNLLIGACARNVRAVLERHSRAWVESLLDTSPASAAVVFEDQQRAGDPDGTRALLREWAAHDTRVRLILAQPLLYPKWSRTQRLALCRNVLAHEAARLPESGVFVAIDLDCRMPPTAQVVGAFASMLNTRHWDVVTANTLAPRYYYDRWALRSTVLTLDYDCWFNASQRRLRGSCPDYAINIDRSASPFGVDSAFNGLGLYRAGAIRSAISASCLYRGTKNSYLCEHVPFHLCMRSLSLRIGVMPSLENDCGSTDVSPRKKIIRLHTNGSVTVQASTARAAAAAAYGASRSPKGGRHGRARGKVSPGHK